MAQTVMVLGLGRFGMQIVRTLAARGVEVIAVDSELRAVEAAKDLAHHAVCLDATDEAALRTLPLDAVDAAVVAMAEDREASVFITALLKKVGVRRIIARATSDLHGRILSEVGAGKVVAVEVQMGQELAETLAMRNVHERSALSTGHVFVEVPAPPSVVGRSLRTLDLRARQGITVIAIAQHAVRVDDDGERVVERRLLDPPDPDYVVQETDTLAVIARPERLRAFVGS